MVRRVGPHGEAQVWCKKWSCGTETDELLQARENDRKDDGTCTTESSNSKKKGCQTETQKRGKSKGRKVTRKECKRLREDLEVGGLTAQK